jgi:hypothetical protein
MGWSCSAVAGDTLDRWSRFCVSVSGSSNVYNDGKDWYMFEISRKEHADGAITGKIMRFAADPRKAASTMAMKAGTFRINGAGKAVRAPQILAKL